MGANFKYLDTRPFDSMQDQLPYEDGEVVGTPPIDNETGFDAQRENILAGMKVTDELRAWIWSHQSVVERWAAIVAAHG